MSGPHAGNRRQNRRSTQMRRRAGGRASGRAGGTQAGGRGKNTGPAADAALLHAEGRLLATLLPQPLDRVHIRQASRGLAAGPLQASYPVHLPSTAPEIHTLLAYLGTPRPCLPLTDTPTELLARWRCPLTPSGLRQPPSQQPANPLRRQLVGVRTGPLAFQSLQWHSPAVPQTDTQSSAPHAHHGQCTSMPALHG